MEWFKPIKKTRNSKTSLFSFNQKPIKKNSFLQVGKTSLKKNSRKYPKIWCFQDADKDGVANIFDCQPFNKKKQGYWHRKAGFSIGDMYSYAQEPTTRTRKSGPRDTMRKEDGKVAVKLHYTDVAVLDPSTNVLKLKTGGWQTPTTKERINKALPEDMRVAQKKHQWKLETSQGEYPFEEGMEIEVAEGGRTGRVRKSVPRESVSERVYDEEEEEEDEEITGPRKQAMIEREAYLREED
jgi:hypothetical protein